MLTLRQISVALVLICAGCSALPHSDPAKSGPFFTPKNVTVNTPRLPATMRRVTVLPVHGLREMTEDSITRVNESVVNQLNQTGRFEVVTLTPDNLRSLTGQATLGSTEALPADLLEKVKKTSGSDAVLFTDVTSYSPYPPLSIGLRMKLVDLATGSIVWAADNIFSASDPIVANSARHFALKLGSDRGPADMSHTILQNPSRFSAYAASATFESLPPR